MHLIIRYVTVCCIQAPGTARPGSRGGAAGGGIGKLHHLLFALYILQLWGYTI